MHDSTGELKPSQHLGLARLASKRFDRVAQLSLPRRGDDDSRLSFKRGLRAKGKGCVSSTSHRNWRPFNSYLHHFYQDEHSQQGDFKETGPGREWVSTEVEKARERKDRGMEERRDPGREKGLVVAYWSFDFRDHPMGYLTKGLFCSHQASEAMNYHWIGEGLYDQVASYTRYSSNSLLTSGLSELWYGVIFD